ncbi:MAG TPA: 30S ribosomal protein S7, partial [Candidatus Hydrogenedentes bacterium]|nr:30S ribosomal protein S7 [Candidatus Hydrogenedentota bacterium]
MARRRVPEKRVPLGDPKYGSTLVAKFISTVMICGKKSIAESIVYGAFDIIKAKVPNEE